MLRTLTCVNIDTDTLFLQNYLIYKVTFKNSKVDLVGLLDTFPRLTQVVALQTDIEQCFAKGDVTIIGACFDKNSSPDVDNKDIDKKTSKKPSETIHAELSTSDTNLPFLNCEGESDIITGLSVAFGSLLLMCISFIIHKLKIWLQVKLCVGLQNVDGKRRPQ